MKYLLICLKSLILISTIILSLPSCAKGQHSESGAIKQAFLKAFNNHSPEDLRQLFDAPMRNRNTAVKLNEKFEQLRELGGSIDKMELDNVSANVYTYRCMLNKMFTLKVVFKVNDNSRLSEMTISNYTYKDSPVLERNTSSYTLPFHGEWYVFWGGKKASENYHNAYPGMRGAFDFWVMGVNGKSSPGKPKHNEDFYAFSKEIIAPTDAMVLYTINNVDDNVWPAMNKSAGGGNVVLLETDRKEYILLAHLKKGSVRVKKGDRIKQGQLLGLCGNSGNSTEPHLHFQTQNLPDLIAVTGAWSHFEKLKVNGKIMKDYIPKRGDKISN